MFPIEYQPSWWLKKKVFITGHTGFKGGWLSLWLHALGAEIYGYALDPLTQPSLFSLLELSTHFARDWRGNLLDLGNLRQSLVLAAPEVVFHLAAQPLVRESYADPLGTLATNIMGTAHLLEAVRDLPSVKAVVVITTDKVYQNQEWVYPYREVDPLGGRDPYSASKAAAEIVTASYRDSFFADSSRVAIATARAGNVIGGGDWAKDRLIPDCLRAFEQGMPVQLRYPQAVRPWQHVLEPLYGYLLLAQNLYQCADNTFRQGWNFGPQVGDEMTVGVVAQLIAEIWGESAVVSLETQLHQPHEAGLLRLDVTKAQNLLGWRPQWSVKQALEATVSWHRAWRAGANMYDYTLGQIHMYEQQIMNSR